MREDRLTVFLGDDGTASIFTGHLLRSGNYWEKIKATIFPLSIFKWITSFFTGRKYVAVDKFGGLDINKYKSRDFALYDIFDEKFTGEYLKLFFLNPRLQHSQRLLENMPSMVGKDEEIENLKAQLTVKDNQIIDLFMALERLDEDMRIKGVTSLSKGLAEIKKQFGLTYMPFQDREERYS
ncbi:MAG: hypothetical protein Q7S22_00435 [Candidatus Micrarchaeota archaeon]|nr:hypothetical protein [Candidatus Micrarchaeota archaeon]